MITETPKTNKWNRLKNWTAEHADVLVAGSVVAGFVGLVTLAVVADIKAENEEAEKLNKTNNWIRDEFSAGNSVFQLSSGSYLSVPRSSDMTLHQSV